MVVNIARTILDRTWTSTGPCSRVEKSRPLSKLGPRHAAGGIIGPVAVEPDHAPFHPPADAKPAGGFQDRVMDRVACPVRDARDAAAEAARDRLGCAAPRPECRFPDPVDAENFQIGSPEFSFLVG